MENVHVQGVDVPTIGLGTYPMTGAACREAVEHALALGYRHVDTAQLSDEECGGSSNSGRASPTACSTCSGCECGRAVAVAHCGQPASWPGPSSP